MGRFLQFPSQLMLSQRGHLFPWVPVCLAVGIGLYFELRIEPAMWVLWLCLAVSPLALLWTRYGAVVGPLVCLMVLTAFGFGLAGMRAHQVASPVLDFRYYGAVEGRIVAMDRSSSDAVRLTLDRVVLERMDPSRTPTRVRVSLHGQQGFSDPRPGDVVILTAHLSGPGGAVEPGGFDFRRHAWFQRLGAVGYTRTPVLLLEKAGEGLWLFKARMWLSARVQSQLEGETGTFAAALMAGERSGMSQETIKALRETNLAHLIAISGLHMGLVAGFVYASLRYGLLLLPWTRHSGHVRKYAAFGALLAAAGYLALSGGSIATQRAFIMAAAGLTALMLDRRVLSLRSVAMAAVVVLLIRPEALLSPGFQMSFAATTALVAVFSAMAARQVRLPGWLGAVASVVISSAVAGAATGPVGMAHFNQIATYGLLANLVSVPVMGLVVVPMGVLAALLMPFGLDWIALKIMGLGLDWILFVAHRVAEWDGAVRPVVSPDPWVLPVVALAGLMLCLWHGRGRWTGLVPLAVAVVAWSQTQRPDILIADTGTLVGMMTPEGRALSRDRGAGFIADTWLENDGRGGDQIGAALLWPESPLKRVAEAQLPQIGVMHIQGKTGAKQVSRCARDQVVVSSVELTLTGGCTLFDPMTLRRTGSVALYLEEGGPRIVTDAEKTGRRLWHPAREKRALKLAKNQ
ncbi:ComEC/Rec2 family competence protein [Tropicibacter naphthalenivorans]|uniref:ComEC family competence protein n=1 Tax=Tropicibacter naphthalenivorans TaxID=441103 RepID=A0A0P1GNH4_9RHOB|nr:ComEC/Rec2 family competence protein [Tropicibacter naphthalenivorans]CUH76867.1 ComEC family competence protein [Tropicibacter naphthalenivorans]SMC62582.1 competence protein ComEC [Tropicibacter naphthalenivorans]